MRLSYPVFLPVLFSFLLVACGGGGDDPKTTPAPTLAAGLSWVDVQDGSGNTVMQHRYAIGSSADEEVVTTTQYQGYDGVWGTADDWRTARTRCRYPSSGTTSPVGFGPELFLGVSASLCSVRRAPSGVVQVELRGLQFPDDDLYFLRPDTSSPSMRELINALGWQPYLNSGDLVALREKINEGPVVAEARIAADGSGVSLCREPCVPTGTEASLLLACGSLCGVAPTPVSDGIVIDLNPQSCGSPMVDVYEGIRAQAIRSGGRLDKVLYSPALNSPYCYVVAYDQYRYDGLGQLAGMASYDGAGSDGVWLTADDVRSSYLSLVVLSDGQRQIRYSAAGEDGVWETGDDVIDNTQQLQVGTDKRLLRATRCSGAGADLTWQTADDVCQVLVFHYSDER